jgi:hypothetical protein
MSSPAWSCAAVSTERPLTKPWAQRCAGSRSRILDRILRWIALSRLFGASISRGGPTRFGTQV